MKLKRVFDERVFWAKKEGLSFTLSFVPVTNIET